jgi:hypothetical protein
MPYLWSFEVLKENMPYRTRGPEGWNFEKVHSILHTVRDILLFGGLRTSVIRALSMGTLITASRGQREGVSLS